LALGWSVPALADEDHDDLRRSGTMPRDTIVVMIFIGERRHRPTKCQYRQRKRRRRY